MDHWYWIIGLQVICIIMVAALPAWIRYETARMNKVITELKTLTDEPPQTVWRAVSEQELADMQRMERYNEDQR